MGQCGSNFSGEHGALSRSLGKKKALLVGINYRGTSAELRGCINDVMNQKKVLMDIYGFQASDIVMLTEDEPKDNWPYKAVIQKYMKWLYEGVAPGDLVFFQYSGHGSQVQVDGQQCDCLCPLDCIGGPWPQSVITDLEINDSLFVALPDKVKSVAVFDCCHSGTVANLSVKRGWSALSGSDQERPRYLPPPAGAMVKSGSQTSGTIQRLLVSGKYNDHELWVYSGCQDNQTSADAYENGEYQGAFTWAFIKALREDSFVETYIDLLDQIRSNLKGKYVQMPALSTTHVSYLNWYYLGKEPTPARELADKVATGSKKALLIGCNYRGKSFELKGCINDVANQKRMLQDKYGFKECDMLVLTDDECDVNKPYKSRIQGGLRWLVNDAKAGDHLFFHFSGHGSQITDRTGTEPTGLSDVICPLDCDKSWPEHVILDTELHSDLFDRLPDGVWLECVFDCCHSGTAADSDSNRQGKLVPMVPQEYHKPRYLPAPQAMSQPGSPTSDLSASFSCVRPAENKKASGFRRAAQNGEHYKDKMLWVFSGCQDGQSSCDAFEDGQHQGAFTWGFLKALERNRYSARYDKLLLGVRDILQGYSQTPMLSTTSRDNFVRRFMGQQQSLIGGLPTCGR